MLGWVDDIERATLENETFRTVLFIVKDDWAAIVPAGVWHNVVNTGEGELKLYSLYSPPEHPAGTVHRTKAEAEAAEHARHTKFDM
jgi:mannose-6-phosphate isomerase-like protein (cupin superfamily)